MIYERLFRWELFQIVQWRVFRDWENPFTFEDTEVKENNDRLNL